MKKMKKINELMRDLKQAYINSTDKTHIKLTDDLSIDYQYKKLIINQLIRLQKQLCNYISGEECKKIIKAEKYDNVPNELKHLISNSFKLCFNEFLLNLDGILGKSIKAEEIKIDVISYHNIITINNELFELIKIASEKNIKNNDDLLVLFILVNDIDLGIK